MDPKKMTAEEFKKKGKELFGDDELQWMFKCPICGNIQCAEDFREYKKNGATPSSVYQECIGRYQKGRRAFGKMEKGKQKSPCDYASYGLFHIGDWVVFPDDKEICVFPFATPEEARTRKNNATKD